jgi:predicted small lipoprotein YifL
MEAPGTRGDPDLAGRFLRVDDDPMAIVERQRHDVAGSQHVDVEVVREAVDRRLQPRHHDLCAVRERALRCGIAHARLRRLFDPMLAMQRLSVIRFVARALIVATLAGTISLALAACGQRGPLYLPDSQNPDRRR